METVPPKPSPDMRERFRRQLENLVTGDISTDTEPEDNSESARHQGPDLKEVYPKGEEPRRPPRRSPKRVTVEQEKDQPAEESGEQFPTRYTDTEGRRRSTRTTIPTACALQGLCHNFLIELSDPKLTNNFPVFA